MVDIYKVQEKVTVHLHQESTSPSRTSPTNSSLLVQSQGGDLYVLTDEKAKTVEITNINLLLNVKNISVLDTTLKVFSVSGAISRGTTDAGQLVHKHTKRVEDLNLDFDYSDAIKDIREYLTTIHFERMYHYDIVPGCIRYDDHDEAYKLAGYERMIQIDSKTDNLISLKRPEYMSPWFFSVWNESITGDETQDNHQNMTLLSFRQRFDAWTSKLQIATSYKTYMSSTLGWTEDETINLCNEWQATMPSSSQSKYEFEDVFVSNDWFQIHLVLYQYIKTLNDTYYISKCKENLGKIIIHKDRVEILGKGGFGEVRVMNIRNTTISPILEYGGLGIIPFKTGPQSNEFAKWQKDADDAEKLIQENMFVLQQVEAQLALSKADLPSTGEPAQKVKKYYADLQMQLRSKIKKSTNEFIMINETIQRADEEQRLSMLIDKNKAMAYTDLVYKVSTHEDVKTELEGMQLVYDAFKANGLEKNTVLHPIFQYFKGFGGMRYPIMRNCGGTVNKNNFALQDMASGVGTFLKQLHSNKCYYGDLKAGNVLVENKAFRVCDYGGVFKIDETIEIQHINPTFTYMSPAVMLVFPYHDVVMTSVYNSFELFKHTSWRIDQWEDYRSIYNTCVKNLSGDDLSQYDKFSHFLKTFVAAIKAKPNITTFLGAALWHNINRATDVKPNLEQYTEQINEYCELFQVWVSKFLEEINKSKMILGFYQYAMSCHDMFTFGLMMNRLSQSKYFNSYLENPVQQYKNLENVERTHSIEPAKLPAIASEDKKSDKDIMFEIMNDTRRWKNTTLQPVPSTKVLHAYRSLGPPMWDVVFENILARLNYRGDKLLMTDEKMYQVRLATNRIGNKDNESILVSYTYDDVLHGFVIKMCLNSLKCKQSRIIQHMQNDNLAEHFEFENLKMKIKLTTHRLLWIPGEKAFIKKQGDGPIKGMLKVYVALVPYSESYSHVGGKVFILGRNRKVTKRGRTSYVTYNKNQITLSEARKLEKRKISKTKQTAA